MHKRSFCTKYAVNPPTDISERYHLHFESPTTDRRYSALPLNPPTLQFPDVRLFKATTFTSERRKIYRREFSSGFMVSSFGNLATVSASDPDGVIFCTHVDFLT